MTTPVSETANAPKAVTSRRGKGQARKGRPTRKPASADPVASHPPTWREEYGISRKTLARMTGLSERTLATREGGRPIKEAGLRLLTGVERLLQELAKVIRKEAIARWLETPSEGFDNLKPIEVMERGEVDRVWRAIYFLGSGTLS